MSAETAQKYFDESGDAGKINKSATDYFVIALLSLINSLELLELEKTIRKDLGTGDNTIFKWNKTSFERKQIFARIFLKKVLPHFKMICVNKKIAPVFGNELYIQALTELLKHFKLTGQIKYDGQHLGKVVESTRRNLKAIGIKTAFVPGETSTNFGIQLADMCAGYIHQLLRENKIIEHENIIHFHK